MGKYNTTLLDRIFITGEDMTNEILIERIKQTIPFKEIRLGKRKTNGYDHFYLFVTDNNLKEWKIKLTVQKLAEPREMLSKTMFDYTHKYDKMLSIDHVILMETFAPYNHQEWMYQQQNGAISFQVDLHLALIALFDTALNEFGDTYKNGQVLESLFDPS